MFKKLIVVFTLMLMIVIGAAGANAQSITVEQQEEVAYELPYHGILPDHPLYFLKSLRDQFLLFLTFDVVKRTERRILISDKRMSEAQALAQKGKTKLATETATAAEQYLQKIPETLKKLKKQKKGGLSEITEKARQSNLKHKEVIQSLLKDLPQGEQEELPDAVKLNQDLQRALEEL